MINRINFIGNKKKKITFFWRSNPQFDLGLFGSSVAATTKKIKKQGGRIGDSVPEKAKWGDRISNLVFMVFEKKKLIMLLC